MRHKVKSTRINRNSAQLKALIRNLTSSIILYETVKTTKTKAKVASRLVDRLIATAKRKDKLNAIRYAKKYLFTNNASSKLIDVLVDRYQDRQSGFTQIIPLWNRKWDNAEIVQIQLI